MFCGDVVSADTSDNWSQPTLTLHESSTCDHKCFRAPGSFSRRRAAPSSPFGPFAFTQESGRVSVSSTEVVNMMILLTYLLT